MFVNCPIPKIACQNPRPGIAPAPCLAEMQTINVDENPDSAARDRLDVQTVGVRFRCLSVVGRRGAA
jgi:hypothetical protein